MPETDSDETLTQNDKRVNHISYPPSGLSWAIWGVGSLLYAIGFFMRTAPAVMTKELMVAFNITAADLGNLASAFFYSYVIVQVPTGLLSRRYGPRLVLTAAAFFTGIGTLIFAMGRDFLLASVGLLLVGGAVGMAIVLTLELSGYWLPKDKFALASGLTMVVGVGGAFLAGMPLSLLISLVGWRLSMAALGILTILLGVIAWILVRDDPVEKGYISYKEKKAARQDGVSGGVLATVAQAFKYRNTWLMLLIPSGVIGAMLSFTGLWGVPYLRARFDLSVERAALVCSAMLIAFALSSPILGYISDRQRKRKPAYVIGVVVATLCWLMLVLWTEMPIAIVTVLLILAAAFSGAMPLSYALGRESAEPENSDVITGAVVTGIMLGPAIIQPVTGWMVDHYWSGSLEAGVRVYDTAAFNKAFLPMLGWMCLASLLVYAVKETHCGNKPNKS